MSGQIILLNGVPRAGKSSIAEVIMQTFPGMWLNLGVDNQMRCVPDALQPSIGLRPGGERPDLEPVIEKMYAAWFAAIAAHAKLGFNVVADFDLHDDYQRPFDVWGMLHEQLTGLPLLVVNVQAPDAVIAARRLATWGSAGDAAIRARFAQAVNSYANYDLIFDTDKTPAAACAMKIQSVLEKVDNP